MTIEITESIARRCLQVVDAGLVKGLGVREPGKFCVEAAICYAMGLPHGDQPDCVAPALRELKIRLNDAAWSSDMARANGLRRLAVAQLGSAGALDEKKFARHCAELAIRKSVPEALRAAAARCPANCAALLGAADKCEREETRESALEARNAADAAANAAYAADAANADAAANAANAAYAAANAAAYAADAADANAAAYAADAAAYAADAAAAARDKSLAEFAECVVQILIDMKAPGCQWLPLTESAND